MPQPHFVQCYEEDQAAVRAELAQGLRGRPAQVAPKFFYDPLGSRLFDAITALPEYYPTRTEAGVFAQHAAAMAAHVPAGAVMVDLGAGCCSKAARLFPVLQPAAYVAVDISVDYLRETLVRLQGEHPQRPMLGLGLDFSADLALPAEVQAWLAGHGLAICLLFGWAGGLALVVAALVFFCLRRLMCQRLGGTTGDTAGAWWSWPSAPLSWRSPTAHREAETAKAHRG